MKDSTKQNRLKALKDPAIILLIIAAACAIIGNLFGGIIEIGAYLICAVSVVGFCVNKLRE